MKGSSNILQSIIDGIIAKLKSLKAVAFSGSYNDLSDKPTIPAAQVNSDWNASSGVAQILNKPTIPSVGNGTLTIQRNGTNVATFTANQSGNATANITVPTNTNQLTNGAGFITSSGSITGNAATASILQGWGATSAGYTFGKDANSIAPGLYDIPNDWTNLPSGTAWATMLVIGEGVSTPQSQTLYDQNATLWTRVKVGANWSSWNRQYQIEFTNNYNVTSRTTWQEIHGTVSRSIQSVMACPSGRQSNSTFKYYTTFSGTTWYVYYMNTTDYSADGVTVWVLT